MKKGQAGSQVFTYLMAALVIVLIVGMGYYGVRLIAQKGSDAQLASFQAKITTDIETVAVKTGTVRTFEYSLPPTIEELCFHGSYNPESVFHCNEPETLSQHPLVENALLSDRTDSIFLIGNNKLERLPIDSTLNAANCDLICAKPNGALSLRFTSEGNYVTIEFV